MMFQDWPRHKHLVVDNHIIISRT